VFSGLFLSKHSKCNGVAVVFKGRINDERNEKDIESTKS